MTASTTIPVTNVIFEPAPDITAYELACVFQMMLKHQNAVFVQEALDLLPETCRRHFKDKTALERNLAALYASGSTSSNG